VPSFALVAATDLRFGGIMAVGCDDDGKMKNGINARGGN
jgi:hypothetical protein